MRHFCPPSSRTSSPSETSSKSGARRRPVRSGPLDAARGSSTAFDETFTTARTPHSASSAAETRSMSAWSTIATSSGPSRLTRSFVRRPSRASTRDLAHGRSSAVTALTKAPPPSMRPARRDARRRHGDPRVFVPGTALRRRRCWSATLAICGRCVIVSTCARSASRCRRAATRCAVSPPTPASISSRTRVSPPATADSASAMRRASPPDGRLGDRRSGSPAFGRTRKTASSLPVGPSSRSLSSTWNSPSPSRGRRAPRRRRPRRPERLPSRLGEGRRRSGEPRGRGVTLLARALEGSPSTPARSSSATAATRRSRARGRG